MSSSHWMFLGDEAEVRRAVLEQPRGQQRLPAGPLARAGVEEEPDQEGRSGRQEHGHQQAVGVGLEDPEHDEEHAHGGEDGAEGVEGTRRVRRDGILHAASEQDDQHDDSRLEDERRPPADRRSDEAADQRTCRRADAPQPADHAEGAGARGEIAEPQGREDVDGRDQQGRADPLEHGVAKDQHAEPGRDSA